MLRKMCAEVIIRHPADVGPVIAALIELDFTLTELHDRIDDDGPARWFLASVLSELDTVAFLLAMQTIVNPLGADVVEAGLASRRPELG